MPESVDLQYAQLTLEQVASTETVSDSDLQAAYDKQKSSFVLPERREASHILIPFGKDPAAALKQANQVLALAKSGQNFAALAKKYSQDRAPPRTAAASAGSTAPASSRRSPTRSSASRRWVTSSGR